MYYATTLLIDAKTAFRQYNEKTLQEARGKYSEDMFKALEEELNSPCTEEMATFDKFARYIEGGEYQVVVFDTAPTGHTLRLLDLPFDYAKQVEMMISTAENAKEKEKTKSRFKNLIAKIRDAKNTVFNLVLYPEATPILEADRARADLKAAGIEIQTVIANMVLPDEACANDYFLNRKSMQEKYLAEIDKTFKLPVIRFPYFMNEIRGIGMIREAARSI